MLIFSLILSLVGPANAASPKCYNRIGGTWNFGSTPSACNVNPTQKTPVVRSQYEPVLFNDSIPAEERTRYMSEMYPVLRETARYYIKRRNPQVSPTEEEAFVLALATLANQESYWTHYREGTDGILRFMRGDNLHGFGIMQVDDRSHLVAINEGKGVDLMENMIYGLDIFYDSWLKSATAWCVNSASNFKDRTRSAWAAYNGGPKSICRWTNPKSRYAQNDKDFLDRYNKQVWRRSVADLDAAAKLDIRCLAEGVRPCVRPGFVSRIEDVREEIAPVAGLQLAWLKREIPYRFLRRCSSVECGLVPRAVRGGTSVGILGEDGSGWVQVFHHGSIGWIPWSDLQRLVP